MSDVIVVLCHRNKYVGIWDGIWDGRSASSSDAIYRRILLFVYSLNHSSRYLFLSREHDDVVKDIGKPIFVRFYVILSYLMLTHQRANIIFISGNRTRDKKVMAQRKSLGNQLNFRTLFLEYRPFS